MKLVVKVGTSLKERPVQLIRLTRLEQSVRLERHTEIPIASYSLVEGDNLHFKVKLGLDKNGKQIHFRNRSEWFACIEHIELLSDDGSPAIEQAVFNDSGMKILKHFEGLELKAYKDAVGVWTIGYGDTRNVQPGMVITEEEAERRLRDRLEEFCNAVRSLVAKPLTDDQFSALVCFAYNVGAAAFKKSTLLRELNRGRYWLAAAEFRQWNKGMVNGKKVELPGLTRRRGAEAALFKGEDFTLFFT